MKVGFLFLFSIFLEKWFLMVFFEFFRVNARFLAPIEVIFAFFRLRAKLKKYRASLYSFYMLIKIPVERCLVHFFTFSDSLKMAYEKGTLFGSYI